MAEDIDSDESSKTRDAGSYDAVTDTFDRLTDRFTGPVAERMVALAQLAASEAVLDVGTGTGIVAFQAAHKVRASGKVIGIDLSEGMLSTATEKASKARVMDRVEFKKMDAEALTFEDCSFDAVLSLFALRHFPHPQIALKEMFRVLRPGRKLVIAVGSGPPLFSFDGFSTGLKRLSELFNKLQGKRLIACEFLNGLVEKYLPESDGMEEAQWTKDHVHLTESVPTLVRSAGFLNVRRSWLGQCEVITTPEEFWEVQVTFSSLARKRISAAPPAKVKFVKEKFMETCQNVLRKGGKLLYPTGGLFVSANRP